MKFKLNNDQTYREFTFSEVRGHNNEEYLSVMMNDSPILYLSKDGSIAIADLNNSDLCECNLEDI